ncbi:MAG TPA: GNAT family N-acetyltransferase [Myxococcota bacterium]|nr:GNAT family N-acetyltransferase [Myxococcota bacterium]
MSAPLRIEREQAADSPHAQSLQRKIDEYNMELTGRRDWMPVAYFLRDDKDGVVGGVVGDIWGAWLHVRVMWVDAPRRRHGHGARLLRAAEELARERGCVGVYLETFSFQGSSWYPRFGYEVVGGVHDFPPGHSYYILQKRLQPAAGGGAT